MLIYDRIKYFASLKSVTLTDVAEATGISTNTMKNWNTRQAPATDILKIVKYFDISMDYFMENCENPNSHKSLKNSMGKEILEVLNTLSDKVDVAFNEAIEDFHEVLESYGVKMVITTRENQICDKIINRKGDPE